LRWNELTRDKPLWVSVCYYLLIACYLGNLAWAAYTNGLGSPGIVDGRYIFQGHSHIIRELTSTEYFQLRSLWLRTSALFYLLIFFANAVYWYYPDATQSPHADE